MTKVTSAHRGCLRAEQASHSSGQGQGRDIRIAENSATWMYRRLRKARIPPESCNSPCSICSKNSQSKLGMPTLRGTSKTVIHTWIRKRTHTAVTIGTRHANSGYTDPPSQNTPPRRWRKRSLLTIGQDYSEKVRTNRIGTDAEHGDNGTLKSAERRAAYGNAGASSFRRWLAVAPNPSRSHAPRVRG